MKKHSTSMMTMMLMSIASCSHTCSGQLLGGTPEQAVKYTIYQPDSVQAGQEFAIGLVLSIKSPWYVYAPTGVNEGRGMIETRVMFTLPPGIYRVGRIQVPEPTIHDGYEVYEGGIVRMTQNLKAAVSLKSGQYEIKGRFVYQMCNGETCMPPVTADVNVGIRVD